MTDIKRSKRGWQLVTRRQFHHHDTCSYCRERDNINTPFNVRMRMRYVQQQIDGETE